MKVKQKKLADGKIELIATATAEEVNKAYDYVESSFAAKLGLRPDGEKSAEQAIKEHLKLKDVASVMQPQVMEALVPFALDAKDIVPISVPTPTSADTLKRGKPYSFKVSFTPKPDVELSSYEPVEITVPKFEYDQSEIGRRLTQITHTYPDFVTDDPRPVAKGDSCLIALKATHNGEEVKNLTTDARVLTTGEGYMPEDFERNIYGMNVGDTKSFSFEAPSWDDEGNTITETYECTVTIKEIKKVVYPELTDEWISTHMPMYDSVDALKKEVRASVEGTARHEYDLQVMGVAQSALAERVVGKIPDEAYEETARSIDQTLRAQLAQQGQDYDEFVKQQGGEQAFNIGLMMQARQTLRCDYALDAVFNHMGLALTDDDIQNACAELNPQNPWAVRQNMEQSGRGFALRDVARRYAASKYVVEHAKITYADQKDGE